MRTCIIILFSLTMLLQGCALAVVGAVAGGAAYVNRDRLNVYYNDSNIAYEINNRIRKIPTLHDNAHINVVVYQRIVLITGQVVYPEQRIKAGQVAQSVPGVRKIYNELAIAGPITTLTRTSDSWLTSKVKGEMILNKNIPARNIKVVTENGVLYLMGTVTAQQGNLATAIARSIPGVQKVITLFEIH